MISRTATIGPDTSHPAILVHGADDVREALRPGMPVTLLSAPGAALYAGCLWWLELMRFARREFPDQDIADMLNCADAAGRALEAIRIGQNCLILSRDSPGFDAVSAIAATRGLRLLDRPPPALDMAEAGAARRLEAWLRADSEAAQRDAVDRRAPLG